MKDNTIYINDRGQRIIHRHLPTSYAASMRNRIAKGGEVKAYKVSGDGSFMWELQLEKQVDIDRQHGLPIGRIAIDMPIVRKKKVPLYGMA